MKATFLMIKTSIDISIGSLVATTMPSSTSTSTKYNCTKLHNLEHFTKIFTEMHRVKVKHTQQLVIDST